MDYKFSIHLSVYRVFKSKAIALAKKDVEVLKNRGQFWKMD